jgi:hypothetical protein
MVVIDPSFLMAGIVTSLQIVDATPALKRG